jgi:ATP-dependent RNA helicase SUPV3L1/SUV3
VKTAAFESCLGKANDLLASLTQEYPATDPSLFLGYFARLGGNISVSRLSTQLPSILAQVAAFARRQATEAESFTRRQAIEEKTLASKQAIAEEINIPSFHETFPGARARRRTLTAILGPTNSGKTHRAFEFLSQAKTGVYLAPLRLMAAERGTGLRESGIRCSLVTGEEQLLDERAGHTASTIEMLNPDKPYEVAVIDGVQMIGDASRGWAWTQALVGVNAHTVIVAGPAHVEGFLRLIAQYIEEPLEIVRTERLTAVEVAQDPLVDIRKAAPGSAFVSFSRRDVLDWKHTLGNANCAAVYGSLSPDVRRGEVRHFAEGEADYLSATDAIAMGLNLPIGTVVFTTLKKWNGRGLVTLSGEEIRQIAGRAGRFGLFEEGVVTALHDADLKRIRRAFDQDTVFASMKAPVAPHSHMLGFLNARSGEPELARLLKLFDSLPIKNSVFSKADVSTMSELAVRMPKQQSGLTLPDQHSLCCCPIDTKIESHLSRWTQWVKAVIAQRPSGLPGLPTYPAGGSTEDAGVLQEAEGLVKLLSAYCWLHYRFPALFPDFDSAREVISCTNCFIANSLKRKIRRRCNECGKPLPPAYSYGICEGCYEFRRGSYNQVDW